MKILTSESVNIGHPDKTCDVIADCFLDAALKEDENSQMAVECAIKNNKLFIYGEATTKAKIDYYSPKHTVVIKLTENKNIYVTGGERRKLKENKHHWGC